MTALQEAIERFNLKAICNQDSLSELLNKEKEQIIAARTDGFRNVFILGNPQDRILFLKFSNTDYFRKKYEATDSESGVENEFERERLLKRLSQTQKGEFVNLQESNDPHHLLNTEQRVIDNSQEQNELWENFKEIWLTGKTKELRYEGFGIEEAMKISMEQWKKLSSKYILVEKPNRITEPSTERRNEAQ